MNAVITLTRSFMRQTMRNRQGLFWTLFFPVVLMVIFSFLGNSQSRINLAVVAPNGQATAVVRAFKQSPLFHVKEMSRPNALKDVQRGQMDAALFVPPAQAHHTTTLTLRYNDANMVSAQQAVGSVEAFVSRADIALSGQPPLFRVSAKAMTHSHSSTYIDFLLPGLLAMMTMQNSLFGIGSGLTRWKEKGVLRRFRVTPVKPIQLLSATVVNYIIIGLASAAIVVGFATTILHASVVVPLGATILVLLLGMATFLSIGFIVAGLSKSQEATIPIINLISFPMMFLSGVFFPVSSFPPFLDHIVQYFPLTYMADALRGLMSGQLTMGATAFGTDILGLLVWLVATGAIASRTWHWE